MTRFFASMIIISLLIIAYGTTEAQSDPDSTSFEITYDETRRRLFSEAIGEQFSERWRLLQTTAGDIPIIRVTRISGQLIPTLRLYDNSGTLLAESTDNGFSDSAELIFETGLEADGAPYQIEVLAEGVVNEVDNPVEYSLSVMRDGINRSSPDEGILPLPTVGLNPPPILPAGDRQTIDGFSALSVFSDDSDIQYEANPSQISNSSDLTLTYDQLTSLTNGIANISFVENGIGLTIRNTNLAINPERRFFSDESFSVTYNEVSRNYTFTMRSGMVLVTSFAQIESIEIQNGFAAVRIALGDTIKRLVFDNQSINVRRSSGDTPNYIIELDDDTITTDLSGWDTLASYLGQLRVYYGMNARFISDRISLNLTQGTVANRQSITLPIIREDNLIDTLSMSLDWHRISEISITDDTLTTQTRNGIQSDESLAELDTIFSDDGAVRFERVDGSFRTVYPDGTDISTRATLASNADTLPYQAGFRTRNYNNLGEDILPTCRCSNGVQAHTPINPVNGNFFYSVTDFSTQGQTLALNLIRYYNSHDSRYEQGIVADSRLTPRYILNAPVAYPRFGDGWRHSYQYELDIMNAPLGRIALIEPDGTSHYFSPSATNPSQWTSLTLLSTRIFLEGGILGAWRAETTDGLRYDFDRVGRLTRIAQGTQSIIITPTPLYYANLTGMSGVFVVGAYGRRIELYTNADNQITIARNSALRPINYSYDNGKLVGVEYEPPTQTSIAQYDYSAVGLLQGYDDVRSPYTRNALITYYPDNRVQNFTENTNSDDGIERQFIYIYEDFNPDDAERVTNRIFEVNGERRVQTWTYNQLWQLVDVQLPQTGWDYQFSYDLVTGLLQSVRVPTDVIFVIAFDERGNLTRFEDPEFTGDSAYNFSYEQRGTRSLLTQIRYPNNRTETFIWSAGDEPQLLTHESLIAVGVNRTTRTRRFQYDELGRLVMLIEPDNTATIYQYDAVGYVSTILEGIAVTSDDTPDTITNDRITRTTSLSYDLSGQLQRVLDTRGTAYNIRWTQAGQISSISTSIGETIRYSYDERGRIININDRGQESIYTYNGLDWVTDFRNAIGAQQTFTYDEAGNVRTIVDGLGATASYQYDLLDNLVSYRSAGGTTTRYETTRDPSRNAIVRTSIDATGRRIVKRYDFLNRLTLYSIFATADTATAFQEFRFEYGSGAGRNLTAIVDTLTGRSLALRYTLNGDVVSITLDESETQFAYNLQGLLTEITSPSDTTLAYDYDLMGNISVVTLPDETIWQYAYDGNNNLQSATNPLGLSTIYTFDELNRIESIIDPLGQIESFSYDGNGNLATITDPKEISTLFTYTPMNQVASITDGAGNITQYDYDLLGRLDTITQTDASPETRITYDNNNNIIAITEQRQRTLYSYDALGRVTSITDPAGHTTSYEYDTVGAIIGMRDALGNTERYNRAIGTNFLQSYTNSAGQTYTLNTDPLGRVTALRLSADSVNIPNFEPIDTQFFYDEDGYITGIQVGTLNARTSGIADQFYQFDYSATGQVIQYQDALERQWSLRYDDAGRLTQVLNPQNVSTQYQYDNADRVTAVTHYVGEPIEFTEQFTYDSNGNISAYEIPDTIRHEYRYNQLNLLSQAQLAVGTDQSATYLFAYNAFRRLTRLIDPSGREIEYLYALSAPDDLATQITTGRDGTRINTSYGYDTLGNLTSIAIAGNEEDVNLSYDSLDRRVRYVDSLDNSWAYTYDAADNIAQISDPLGSVVAYTYDAYNRVISMTYPSGTVVALRYDSAGHIASVISPANVAGVEATRYQLDEAGQLRAMQVGTSTVQFFYDALGNIIRRTAPDGTITTYTYDASGRLLTTAYSNSSDEPIQYAYDALGNQTRIGEIDLSYDLFGRILRSTQNHTVAYDYSAIGNLESRQSDLLGTTTYRYDDLNRVQAITYADQQINIVYDAIGRIDSYTRGDLTTQFTYDENDRVVQVGHFRIIDGRPNRIDVFTYNYDAVGNLIKVERLEADGQTTEVSYSYDIDQRLISERWLSNQGETFYSVNYRYDAIGNRLEENRNGRITTFTYNAQNQLVREQRNVVDGDFSFIPSIALGLAGLIFIHRRRKLWIFVPVVSSLFVGIAFAQSTPQITVEYEYDTNGNMTLVRYIGQETYTLDYDYDNENRLVRVQGQVIAFEDDNDEISVDIDTQYIYDELSRLVNIRTSDTDYTLYYDGHTLIGMSDGEQLERYVSFNGQRLMTITGDEQVLWNLNDRQGSTRRYTDRDATLLEDRNLQLEFGAFGTRIFPYNDNQVAPFDARVTAPSQFFAGQLYDPSTRLYIMGVRAYDPIMGRFLQPDPIRHDPVGTLYTYARNRPLTFFDPTGMSVAPLTSALPNESIRSDIRPDDLINQPDDMDIPIPPSVNQLQSDEIFRALELVRTTRYGVNEPIVQLSPLYNDLYLVALNPIPQEVQSLLAQPLDTMMSIYNSETGWQPDLIPQTMNNNNPFTVLDDLMLTLAPAYIDPLTFNETQSISLTLLPQVSLPQGISAQIQLENELFHLLQPIQPLIGLSSNTDDLLNIVPPNPVDKVTLPSVALPTALIEPPILIDLDDLRQQTYAFYNRIWSIGLPDCTDCLPALGFNQ